MKHIFRNIAIASLVASGLAVTSCKDMMTLDTGDKTYVNAQDTLYSYLGIMRAMQDVAERQVILGEIRGDLVSSTEYVTDTLRRIAEFDAPLDREEDPKACSMLSVRDYYNLINNCNLYVYNADTTAIKQNVRYMLPEYAQVKAVRAWAYLQLVKNYGTVPFITRPVNSLDVITSFDYANNLVNKDNLVDKIVEDGLLNLVEQPYPSYGSTTSPFGEWDYGAGKVSSRLCCIPIRVLLGDMYLLRGANTADYEKAAKYYLDFLTLDKASKPLAEQAVLARTLNGGLRTMESTLNGWGAWGNTNTTVENITVIPSSSNAGLGKMLTRVADIWGYTPTSSQSSEETTNDDGDATGEFEASGSVSVTHNYKMQFRPSEAYMDVNYDQTYVTFSVTDSTSQLTASDSMIIPNYDSRMSRSVEDYIMSVEGKNLNLTSCAKAARSSAFYYLIPIYRKTLIWLRLAEALNRAGYPEYAFAILKEGLNKTTVPVTKDAFKQVVVNITIDDVTYPCLGWKNDAGDIRYEDQENGVWYEAIDDENPEAGYKKVSKKAGYVNELEDKTQPIRKTIIPENGRMYYLDMTDQARIDKFNATFDFTNTVFNGTYGIHAKGCGLRKYLSTSSTFVYYDLIAERSTGMCTTGITGYNDTVYYDYNRLVNAQLKARNLGVTVKTASQQDIIDAVENIIVDELALETAFEGNRFTDLVRVAEHKNASGVNGTEWLANKIAKRGSMKAVPGKVNAVDNFNGDIYGRLQNRSNWYLPLPAWK